MNQSNSLLGRWNIYKMEVWGKDYFNMEIQAYIQIDNNLLGNFQFGLVSGDMDGKFVEESGVEKYRFNWEGNDECDAASGNGWVKMKDKDIIGGEFEIFHTDSSTFMAKRVVDV